MLIDLDVKILACFNLSYLFVFVLPFPCSVLYVSMLLLFSSVLCAFSSHFVAKVYPQDYFAF
jgi:hypothetical protein